MTDRSIILLPDEAADTRPASEHDTDATMPPLSDKIPTEVGESATFPHWSAEIAELRAVRDESTNERLLSDLELAEHIAHCGRQMLAANVLLESGCVDYFGMRGERDRWRMLMEAALRERHRRPHLVAQLEAERDLA